jgi:osmotically-inducible protein OsmY
MTSTIDDSELRRAVIAELEWDPSIDASGIAIAVKEGVVTLAGTVRSYAERLDVERGVKRLSGVRGIADELEVRLAGSSVRSDADIAQSVLSALRFNVAVPDDQLRVTVDRGWVRLEGEVEWQYQRGAAESSVRPVMGVKGVTNDIVVKPRIKATDVRAEIEDAFAHRRRERRHGDASRIGQDMDRQGRGGTGRVVCARRGERSQRDRRQPLTQVSLAHAFTGPLEVETLEGPSRATRLLRRTPRRPP